MKISGGKLVFIKASREQSGKYTVRAENQHGVTITDNWTTKPL